MIIFLRHSSNKSFIIPNNIHCMIIQNTSISKFLIIFDLSKAIRSWLFRGFFLIVCLFFYIFDSNVVKLFLWHKENLNDYLIILILSYLSTSYIHIGFFISLEWRIPKSPKGCDNIFILRETQRFVLPVTWLSKPIIMVSKWLIMEILLLHLNLLGWKDL